MTAIDKIKPAVDPENKRAGWLLGGLTLLTTVFTAVGISNDELPNVWRNHEILSYTAVTLILVAVALGAVAGWVLEGEKSTERKVLLWGNALLGLGVIFAAWAGIATASDRPEPTITAVTSQQDGKTLLKVQVENSNLDAREDLNVMIEPLLEVEGKGGEIHYRVSRALYSASLGPSEDGKVSRSIEIEVPPGNFDDIGVRAAVDPPQDCYDEDSTTSCVVVRIPQRSEQPQLTFKWRRKRRGMGLRVHVTAADIPNRALQVSAYSLRPKRRLLTQANIAPTLDGDVDRSFVLPVGKTKIVCVAADTGVKRLKCPPTNRNHPAWARLRVPGRR